MKFAKGKWKWVSVAGRQGGNRSLQLRGENLRILTVKPGTVTPGEGDQRLIERAPEIYRALKEYLDWHEVHFALPSGNFEDPDQMTLARDARAALAGLEDPNG